MSDIHGADPDDLDALARYFDETADRLLGLLRDSRDLADRAAWVGADADGFRRHIPDDLGSSVTRSSESVRRAAEALRRNANQQRQASDAPGPTTGALTMAGSPPGTNTSSGIGGPDQLGADSISDVVLSGARPPNGWRDNPRIAALIDLVGSGEATNGQSVGDLGDLTDIDAHSDAAVLASSVMPLGTRSAWAEELFGRQ